MSKSERKELIIPVTFTTAETQQALAMLNRCVRMDAARLQQLLVKADSHLSVITEGADLAAAALLTRDASGFTLYLARGHGQSDPVAVDRLTEPLRQAMAASPSIAATVMLDGYDAEAAQYCAAQGHRQIDCDYLLSTNSSGSHGGLAVHPYRPEELAEYIRVFDQAFLPLRAANGREPYALWSSRPDWAQEWFEGAAARGEMASIWIDGQMAACYRLDGDTIDSLAVLPERQGRGIGRAIINHCISEIRGKGYPRAYLYVAETNLRARSLYEQMGFQIEMISR
ncbi:MAG: GNAT family N-acetyltransferase, partial [Bacillota bacterium]